MNWSVGRITNTAVPIETEMYSEKAQLKSLRTCEALQIQHKVYGLLAVVVLLYCRAVRLQLPKLLKMHWLLFLYPVYYSSCLQNIQVINTMAIFPCVRKEGRSCCWSLVSVICLLCDQQYSFKEDQCFHTAEMVNSAAECVTMCGWRVVKHPSFRAASSATAGWEGMDDNRRCTSQDRKLVSLPKTWFEYRGLAACASGAACAAVLVDGKRPRTLSTEQNMVCGVTAACGDLGSLMAGLHEE